MKASEKNDLEKVKEERREDSETKELQNSRNHEEFWFEEVA